jgi:AraC family transcriptional regulator of adaptative response/methylated-DNA-[protein]-cysteine methyltransferase
MHPKNRIGVVRNIRYQVSMPHAAVIANTIDYLVAHHTDQPDLAFLAKRAGYEATYFQKLFKEYTGISPKRMVQYMNMRHARELLERGDSTLAAALQSGLSGNGRLHDLFVACEGVSPGDVQSRGRGIQITYGFYPSPIGEMMIGKTSKGLCWLGFVMQESRAAPMERMKRYWPHATFHSEDAAIADEGEKIISIWRGQGSAQHRLKLDLYGTNFQIQVWQALLKIPGGETRTYQEIAQNVGKPRASRAIGNAVGANPVSLIIPCHRVIRATGIIDNYGWGSPRKKIILAME